MHIYALCTNEKKMSINNVQCFRSTDRVYKNKLKKTETEDELAYLTIPFIPYQQQLLFE